MDDLEYCEVCMRVLPAENFDRHDSTFSESTGTDEHICDDCYEEIGYES